LGEKIIYIVIWENKLFCIDKNFSNAKNKVREEQGNAQKNKKFDNEEVFNAILGTGHGVGLVLIGSGTGDSTHYD